MWEAWKIFKHIACHTMCGSDKECHKTSCANPWVELEAKCDLYWNVSRCHRACGWDRECHYKCPRMPPHGHHHWHHMDDEGISHEHGHWHHHGEDENPHEPGYWHRRWHHAEEKEASVP